MAGDGAMDVAGLVSQAMASAGFAGGEGDEYLAGLRVLLADLEDGSHQPELVARMRATIAATLHKRFALLAQRAARPAIAQEAIARPIFVIGLFCIGISALVDLLSQDPGARCAQQWEVAHLGEPMDPASWADDPRIAALDARFRAEAASNPVVALGLHTYGATLPDECNSFLSLNFWSPNLSVFDHFPRYVEWLRHSRISSPYAMHRKVLQHLQHSGGRGQWVLKSPFHVFDLPGILDAYPDAVFIQTHRDPVQLIASNCGLHATIRGEGPGDPRRLRTGPEQLALWGTGLQRALAARQDPAVDQRVVDLSHRDLLDDPLGVVRRLYALLGDTLSAEAEARMERWIAAPAQHLSSVRFSLAEFGLTDAAVDAAFGPYRSRFARFL